MESARYTFEPVANCEMCGESTDGQVVLGQRMNRSQGLRPKSISGISVSVMKCRNCDLIFPQPLPIPLNLQDHYGIPPENYWNEGKLDHDRYYFVREIGIAKELLAFTAGMTALDIGAGLGQCMISLENAGFDTHGIEPSQPFYERAVTKMKIDPEKLKMGMVEDVDYPEASFDLITYGAVFEHIYHPARSLEKVLRWLKPNGIVHLEVPSSRHFITRLMNFYFKLAGTNFVSNLSPMHAPFHLYEFGLKSFEKLGDQAGFKIEEHYFEVCDIYFIPRIFHPVLRKYMELTDSGMQLMVYLRKTELVPQKN